MNEIELIYAVSEHDVRVGDFLGVNDVFVRVSDVQQHATFPTAVTIDGEEVDLANIDRPIRVLRAC